jgi:CBS domain containing-hemolysin-like protein
MLFLASIIASGAALIISLADAAWFVQYPAALAVVASLGLLQVLSRGLAPAFGEPLALRIAPYAARLAAVLRPVLAVEAAIGRRAVGSQTRETASQGESPSREPGAAVEANGEPIDEREARMIRGIVALDQTTAREIMTPRVDMVTVKLDTPVVDLVEQMLRSGHSRVPVYSNDLDHIEGIAYSRDILGLLSSDEGPPITLPREVIKPAIFIPETKTLEELLSEFQERQVHLAVVIDEYGGVSGLVTIEDLLEEIVGEIQDEFDFGEPEIEALNEGEYLIDAGMGIDELDELLDVRVEGDGFDTLGGFVYDRLGKIPSSGDVLEYDGLKIEVVSTEGRRVKQLRVTRVSPP